MSLITQLKNEHDAICRGLEKAYALQSDPTAARHELDKVKNILLQHLRREDVDLYPVLDRAAEESGDVKRMLEEYRDEMEGVSRAALDFFAKAEAGELEGFRFAREFGQLSTVLTNRIKREENKLYPAYERLELRE